MRAALLGVVLAAHAPLQAQPKYVLERKDGMTVRATATYEIETPNLRVSEWVLFAAVPPACDGQRDVKTSLRPAGSLTREGGSGRSVLRARVAVRGRDQQHSLTASVTYDATLMQRTLRELAPREVPPTIPPLSADERKRFLAPSRHLDFHEPAFKRWIEKQPAEADPVDQARRVFSRIRESAAYEYKPDVPRRASEVCVGGKTDCGGLSAWFVAAMRARGVPARMRAGRWAASADARESLGDALYYKWHVTAEFHAADVGWIPVDVSTALQTRDPKQAATCFGNEPGDFLTLHFDTDLKLDTIHFGTKTLPFLQDVPYWVKGEGTLDGSRLTQSWAVTKQ